MKRILIIGYIVAVLSVVITNAQSQQAIQEHYKFKYLTVDQGLSNNWVRSICQDSQGFIWFGTQNGASKFDGQTIVSYRHDPDDSTSLSSNILIINFLDSKSNLWIGTSKGLDLYNSDFDNFIRFSHKDIDWPIGQVYSIAEDKIGQLWFGGITGLYAYNLNTSEIKYFSNKVGNPHGIPPYLIYRLLADKNNNIWISILNEGLCIYNQNDGSFKCFKNEPEDPSTISDNRIEKLYEDSKGNIWAGTMNNGLNLFVPESNSFLKIIPDSNNSYSTRVREIFEDLRGNLFIGTRSGLYVHNNQTNEFISYAYKGHSFSSLSQNSIYCSFIDKTKTLWIGTYSGGVNYTNLIKKEFTHYKAGKDDHHMLCGAIICAITEDPKGNLWVGSDNGLNYLDRITHNFKYYFNDPKDPSTLSYNDVKALDWDNYGNLWIGTNKGGLNYYNVKTGNFKSYKHDPDNPNSLKRDKIYGIMCDMHNNLWILTNPEIENQYSNIDILPDGSDKFIHLNEKAYFGFDEDVNGDVFIGGINGFWIFSRSDSIYNFISNDTLIDRVNVIRLDSKKRIWIGSNKGLIRYNREDKSFLGFSVDNGYPVNEVFGILEDDRKNLWVSTNFGLIKITNIVEDIRDITFRVFDSEDGLQSMQFHYNAYYKCRSGEMAFGGINGFNTFYPAEITEDTVPPSVIITDLIIFNTSTPIGEKVGGRLILEKSISVTEEITLGRKQNVFTLEFAALHYANPGKNTFKYKLEGFDKDWQYRKAGNNFATYTNLSAGKYTFMVTAANNDGVWNEEPVRLKITVIPPFWKIWWLRLLVSFIFIGQVLGIYLYRVRSIRKRNSELEEALAQAKESDKLKSAFLANMSHEIRTPMNAIVGFTSLMNDSDTTSEERAEFIQIIESNSKGLLKIIDEILDLSLIESKQLRLTKQTFDLNVIIEHIFSYYLLSNSDSKVEFRKNNTLQSLKLRLNSDSVRLKQILTNLMDNAIKFTKEGFIELGTYKDDNDLCIYVKDTGRGIPSEMMDHIFQQFIKVEDDESEWTRGLGLGLALSQKIANALGGKILVKSAPGKGSTFTFRIPLDDVIIQDEIPVEEIREPIPVRLKGKTILIAEDVEANYLYLKNILKRTKTNIIRAKNGEEALTQAIENPNIDLILMDIKMPVLNGYEAAKKIKEHNPNIIIVALTAYARPEEKVKFYNENFDEYLSKPIKPLDLLMVLEQFL